jgi:hypothetical protein
MRQLRVYFSDFWGNFDHTKCGIGIAIFKIFPNAIIIAEPIDVDLCVYSVFGENHKYIDARYKISYTGEPYNPNNDSADLAIGFDIPKTTKESRFPLWKWTMYEHTKFDKNTIEKLLLPRTNKYPSAYINKIPLAALYSNHTGIRSTLLPECINNGICASYGKFCKTHQLMSDSKLEMFDKHPCYISVENCQKEGYVTEKLFEPLYNNVLPFYWGSTTASQDFNPGAFVNLSHFNEYEGDKACAFIKNILNHPKVCSDLHMAPIFTNYPEIEPLYDAIRNVVVGYD